MKTQTKCRPLLSKVRRAGDAAQVGKPTEHPRLAALCISMAVSEWPPLSPLTVIHFLWLAESERGSYRNLLFPSFSFHLRETLALTNALLRRLAFLHAPRLGTIHSCIVIRQTFRALSYARREAAPAMKRRPFGNSAQRPRLHDGWAWY